MPRDPDPSLLTHLQLKDVCTQPHSFPTHSGTHSAVGTGEKNRDNRTMAQEKGKVSLPKRITDRFDTDELDFLHRYGILFLRGGRLWKNALLDM